MALPKCRNASRDILPAYDRYGSGSIRQRWARNDVAVLQPRGVDIRHTDAAARWGKDGSWIRAYGQWVVGEWLRWVNQGRAAGTGWALVPTSEAFLRGIYK